MLFTRDKPYRAAHTRSPQQRFPVPLADERPIKQAPRPHHQDHRSSSRHVAGSQRLVFLHPAVLSQCVGSHSARFRRRFCINRPPQSLPFLRAGEHEAKIEREIREGLRLSLLLPLPYPIYPLRHPPQLPSLPLCSPTAATLIPLSSLLCRERPLAVDLVRLSHGSQGWPWKR